MTLFAFPSRQFPGPASMRVEIPAGWSPARAPDVAMAFVDDESPEGTPTNLLFLTGRAGGDPTLEEVAAMVRDRTSKRFPGTAVVGTDARRVDGRPAIRTVLRVPLPDRELVQAQTVVLVQAQTVVALAAADELREFVQVHLTCRADQWERRAPVLDAVLDSLRLG